MGSSANHARSTGLAARLRNIAYYRTRRALAYSRVGLESLHGALLGRSFVREGPRDLDPRVRLPAYKSLDPYLDVEHLRSLDGFLCDKVRQFLASDRTEAFHTGKLKQRFFTRGAPGSRVINLTEPTKDRAYFLQGAADYWRPAPFLDEFEPLMEFVRTLPMRSTGRIIIMADPVGRRVTAHRDHNLTETRHEFVWFRTNLHKPFYVQDVERRRKEYVRSYTAWFDTVNQYHGADATGELSISVRVDGRFTEEFLARAPEPGPNRASHASLWASVGDVRPPTGS